MWSCIAMLVCLYGTIVCAGNLPVYAMHLTDAHRRGTAPFTSPAAAETPSPAPFSPDSPPFAPLSAIVQAVLMGGVK